LTIVRVEISGSAATAARASQFKARHTIFNLVFG
jgi:hypothetical protein